jgi:hypothetical protein
MKNEQIKITVSQKTIEGKQKIGENIPEGITGLTVRIPGMIFLELPGFGIINKI